MTSSTPLYFTHRQEQDPLIFAIVNEHGWNQTYNQNIIRLAALIVHYTQFIMKYSC